MAEVNYESQPLRPCLGCGKTDRAPRDQVGLPDGNSAFYHMDCHVIVADCEVCKKVLEAVGTDASGKGLKNEKLLDALIDATHNPDTPTPEIFTTNEAVPQPNTSEENN